MGLIYYAGTVWWDWPGGVVNGLIGLVIVTSPISWYTDERKRARKRREAEVATHGPVGDGA